MQASLSTKDRSSECSTRFRAFRTLGIRATFLFINFFLIIMALYNLKPASRSLFIEYLGADQLPYIWIGTALTMGAFITYYHRLVKRYCRHCVVLGSCLVFSGLLIMFRLMLTNPNAVVSACFYIFVDILGVTLVEQFWSLTNSIYSTEEGKSWYGFVGTGGLVGGVMGGGTAALIIKYTALQTTDLLLVAAGIISLIFAITWIMGTRGIYCEANSAFKTKEVRGGWRILRHSRYLLIIASILLLAQLASPLVEFQFLKKVETVYQEQEARTAFLSMFFSLLGLISILVNLVLTPLIQRHLGVIAGLLVQPLALSLCSWGFLLQPTLLFGAAAKISDRGLSYSINRASKELLYVPVDPVLIYQAKAWIDMFGYRLFKIFGSILILLATQLLMISFIQLSWFTLNVCAIWIGLILILRHDYRLVSNKST